MRGSRSKAGAGREIEDRAGGEARERGERMDVVEDGETAAGGDWERAIEDTDSMVMAGQEEGDNEAAGVGKLRTGPLEHDPHSGPELKAACTLDGKGLKRSGSDD